MQRIKIPINSFEFGELSPSFTSRVDTEVYKAGANTIKNLMILGEGGLKKRPGTSRIAAFSSPSVSTGRLELRLEPFVFSDDERYIFAFSNARLEIFQIHPTTGVVSSIQVITQDVDSAALPWTTARLEQFTYATNADFMFVCHSEFATRNIVRTSLTTFQVETFAFDAFAGNTKVAQPYYDFHGTGITITPSATSGTGKTLTTSASYFTSDHVGSYIKIHDAHCEITGFTSATVVTATIYGTIRKQLSIDALRTVNGSDRVVVTHPAHGLSASTSVTVDRADTVGGIAANNINGSRTIAEILDDNSYEITAGASATSSAIGGGSPRISSTGATSEFQEQSYSTVRGFPQAVTFHENRLWFGGTPSQPDFIWGSQSARYFNFDIGSALDNESIEINGGFGAFSQVKHLVSNRDLQVFGTSSESYVPALTERPITPTNAQVKRQTAFGAADLKPQPFDGTTIYLQANGKMVGSYLYNDAELAYNTSNIAVTAPHLVKNPTQATVLQGGFSRPESYIYFVNPDGTLSTFYSLRSERKAGWAQWSTSGNFHSLCSVGQRLFTAVQRDNGSGSNAYYLEEVLEDIPMDYSKEYSGSSGVFTVSGEFANGAKVKVVSGTDFLGEFTVASGEVDVSAVKSISSAFIGYQFDIELITLPIDANIATGVMTSDPRHIVMVTLDLVDTLSVSVNNKDLIIRSVTDDFSLARSKFNGRKEFRLLGYNQDPKITISQDVPFDLQINGMVIEVVV